MAKLMTLHLSYRLKRNIKINVLYSSHYFMIEGISIPKYVKMEKKTLNKMNKHQKQL